MSQFNVYGIGAGRSIAAAEDDNNQRLQQRRQTTAQRLEQERRMAALRERLMQTEHSAAAQEAQSFLRYGANLSPERKQAIDEQQHQILWADDEEFTEPAKPGLPPPGLTNPEPSDPYVKRAYSSDSSQQEMPSGVLAEPGLMASQQSSDDQRMPVQSLNELTDKLHELNGPEFAEKLGERLKDVLALVRRDNAKRNALNHGDEMYASLDFIEGYVEASNIKEANRQQLTQLMVDLREQMVVGSALLPGAHPATATAAKLSQRAVDGARAAGLIEPPGNVRHQSSGAQKKRLDEDSRGNETEFKGTDAAMLQIDQRALSQPSKSNLSKDADKRREETLVSVTVRSV